MLAAAGEVDVVARWLAVVAVLLSVAAAVFSHRQAQAQNAANAPKVKAEVSRSEGKRPDGSAGTLRLTFDTGLRIQRATITIRDGSALTALGAPNATSLGLRPIILTDIASNSEVVLPAEYVDGERAKVSIKMKGKGFGTVRTNLDPEVGGGFMSYVIW